ncbi:MAG: type III pantothenate kinase [Gemmatimonadota bacterium]|jgi:type III pantothenate kinase
MILVIDVGNTESVLGCWDGKRITHNWRFRTDPDRTGDELALLVRGLLRDDGVPLDRITGSAIASVVPPVTAALADTFGRKLRLPLYTIHAGAELPIRLLVDEPMTVGPDRIANTLAAAALYKRDTIAVDLGTATTFDCITATGDFVGGVISPGLRAGAETLVRKTAKLPRVDLDLPPSVIGTRTETSLRSGIFFGAVEAIDGIVRRIKREWNRPDALVVATGGLAPFLAPHCESIEHVELHLTLIGIALAQARMSDPSNT